MVASNAARRAACLLAFRACIRARATGSRVLALREATKGRGETSACGRSQSGRALRMFLNEGFNADERGRQVFDGAMPQIAGGGQGFFNHRFASPTQTSTQHNGHLYPVDRFPFSYGTETDPFTGRRDSLLRQARETGTVPKVMHLDTTSEYWHRSGSLVVTDPAGERDSELPPEVRPSRFYIWRPTFNAVAE